MDIMGDCDEECWWEIDQQLWAMAKGWA